MTNSPSEEYLDLVVDIHDRQYQKYSLDRSVYHLPVDEVCYGLLCFLIYPCSSYAGGGQSSPLRPTSTMRDLAILVLTGEP